MKDSVQVYPANATAHAAKIGNIGYGTLDAAIAAAKNGNTVTLLKDATLTSMITLEKSLTIDLNGHNLNRDTGHSIVQVVNNATLTINGTTAGSGVYGRINLGIASNNNGNAVLNGGSYSCANGDTVLHINGTCLDSDVTISNAMVSSPDDNGIQLNGCGTFLIENSTITGATAVYIKSGTTTIRNCTLTGTMNPANYTYNGNGANPTGDAVVIDACNYPGGNPIVNIESGTFGGTKAAIGYYQYNSGTATISVTGGTFSTDPSAYVAEGYHAKQSGSNSIVHTSNAVLVPGVDATCTTPGIKEHYHCDGIGCENVYYMAANCKEAYTWDTDVIAALGHALESSWTSDETQHWHKCSNDASEKIDAAAHTLVKSAAADGQYTMTCSVCGYSETIDADDHIITIEGIANGTVVASVESAKVGDTVTLTLTPDKGYSEAQLTVNGEALSGTTFTMPDEDVTITGSFAPIVYTITYNLNGGTNAENNPTTYTVKTGFELAYPTKDGFTFLGWTMNRGTDIIKDVVVRAGSTGHATFTAQWSYTGGSAGSSGGGGGGSSSSNTTTTTEKNTDGSTTTTVTDKTTGTVTETTKNTDGSTTTVETKKDGTVTETVKTATGTTGTVVTDKNGEVTSAKATVSTTAATEAAKTGAAVTLPVEVPAAKTTEDAPAVEVTLSKSTGSVKVEIPVEKVTPGTVAVIVNADGTEKIVSTSVVTENGVALNLSGNSTVKIIDNSKTFTDVPANNVFYNEITSLSARDIMIGKSDDKFDLYNSVTLNQISNVAGRITGDVDVKDYAGGVAWGNDKGLKTGDEPATRGDVLKVLFMAAGSPAVEDTDVLSRFKDSDSIPEDLIAAAIWAAKNNILKGDLAGYANLGVNVTRGQACALAGRTMGTLA